MVSRFNQIKATVVDILTATTDPCHCWVSNLHGFLPNTDILECLTQSFGHTLGGGESLEIVKITKSYHQSPQWWHTISSLHHSLPFFLVIQPNHVSFQSLLTLFFRKQSLEQISLPGRNWFLGSENSIGRGKDQTRYQWPKYQLLSSRNLL